MTNDPFLRQSSLCQWPIFLISMAYIPCFNGPSFLPVFLVSMLKKFQLQFFLTFFLPYAKLCVTKTPVSPLIYLPREILRKQNKAFSENAIRPENPSPLV